MRVLITGAAGFLGRHFVHYYASRGHEVIALDNLSASTTPPFAFMQMDAGEFFEYANGVDVDLAIHLAAPVGGREKIEGDPMYNADSLRLDSLFFRWAIKHAKDAVYPSSSAVYGWSLQKGNGTRLRESRFVPSEPEWSAPDEMYGFTKMAGEVLAWKSAVYGLNTLCIRPFSGYGPGQSTDYPVPAICRRAMLQNDPLVVWGSGTQTRDFVHVIDIVEATAARLPTLKGYAAMNIGSGEPISFVRIAKMAAEIVGYAPTIQTDDTKPEGVHTRYADPAEMRRFYTPKTDLYAGLSSVMQSLAESRSSG